jgi:hypothetical protein
MRFFRREIELAIKTIGVLTLITLVALPMAWGYGQHQKARTWQSIACAYRIREAERRAPIITGVDFRRDPCATLNRLGLQLDLPQGLASAPRR